MASFAFFALAADECGWFGVVCVRVRVDVSGSTTYTHTHIHKLHLCKAHPRKPLPVCNSRGFFLGGSFFGVIGSDKI